MRNGPIRRAALLRAPRPPALVARPVMHAFGYACNSDELDVLRIVALRAWWNEDRERHGRSPLCAIRFEGLLVVRQPRRKGGQRLAMKGGTASLSQAQLEVSGIVQFGPYAFCASELGPPSLAMVDRMDASAS